MARNLNDTYATRGAAVTASDTVDLDKQGFLYIGTTGNIKVTTTEGDTLTFNGIAAGIVHPIFVKKVFSTGTTASNILVVF